MGRGRQQAGMYPGSGHVFRSTCSSMNAMGRIRPVRAPSPDAISRRGRPDLCLTLAPETKRITGLPSDSPGCRHQKKPIGRLMKILLPNLEPGRPSGRLPIRIRGLS
jgi:hypothetical protein